MPPAFRPARPLPPPILGLALLLTVAMAIPRTADAQARSGAGSEGALRHAVQKAWLDLAELAINKEARSTALRALDRAQGFDPDPSRLPDLKTRAAALASDVSSPVVDRKESATLKRVVSLLNKLARSDVSERRRSRMDGYLWKALELDPDDRGSIGSLRRLAKEAGRKEELGRARTILDKARAYDVSGIDARKYLLIEALIGRKEALLVKAPGHSMLAWLKLPPSWTPKGRWDLVVHVEGADCWFREALGRYRRYLDESPYMVLVPATFSQTELMSLERFPYDIEVINRQIGLSIKGKLQYDAAGLEALLEVMQRRFLARSTHYVTGTGSGGYLVHWWTLHHPDDLVASAPVSPRWKDICADGAVRPHARGPWVRILDEAKDRRTPSPVENELEAARGAYVEAGFQRIDRVRVPKPYEPTCTREVLAFFDEVSKQVR